MTSMDQAFVKAFARRNRRVQTQVGQHQNGVVRDANQVTTTDAERPTSTRLDDEPGLLQVDHSVARTAQVWVDPIEEQIARADDAASDLPRPHVDPPVASPSPSAPAPATTDKPASVADEPLSDPPSIKTSPWVESSNLLQHIHTAYATAMTELPVMPIDSASPTADVIDNIKAPASNEPSPIAAVAAPTTEPATRHASPVEPTQPAEQTPMPESVTAEPTVTQPLPPQQPPAEVTQVRVDPPQPLSPVPFQAAWEVDVFDVPTSVADLFFDGALFQQIAQHLSEAVSSGLSSILVTSAKAGEGRTSVAIGLAMASAAAGIRVALVDADTQRPTLADDLRLDLQHGWVDTVRSGLPIREVAVHAVEDGVTLIPLMPPRDADAAATAAEVAQLIQRLREQFELVIVDGWSGTSSLHLECASVIDSAVIVRDRARTDDAAVYELSYRLRQSGIQGVGVAENFAS